MRIRTALPLTLAVLATTTAGCGGGDDLADTPAEQGASPATLRVVGVAPDALDPALSYTVNGWEILSQVYTPLLTYDRSGRSPDRLVPGLAAALPTITDDGRTYTFTLRPGLRFSDGTALRASDVKRSIERMFALQSPGSGLFSGIAGSDAGLEGRPITGITTDDSARRAVIRLTEPDSTFAYKLALPFTSPVPRDTPKKNTSAAPPPGVGAYRIVSASTRSGTVLERVDPTPPGITRPGVRRIVVRPVNAPERQVQLVLRGDADDMQDTVPAQQLRELRQRHAEHFRSDPGTSVTFAFLNHDVPPFDDPRARQAVALAVDRGAVARLSGGLFTPGCSFIPPAAAGHRKDACQEGAPDLVKAKALLREAGATGARVKVWGPNEGADRRLTTYLAETMRSIGLDARPQLLAFSVYPTTIGARRTRAQAGILTWVQDYAHPLGTLGLFEGSAITPTNTLNAGFVDDDELDASLDAMAAATDTAALTRAAQDSDARMLDQTHAISFGYPDTTTFTADRIDPACVRRHPVLGVDLGKVCLER